VSVEAAPAVAAAGAPRAPLSESARTASSVAEPAAPTARLLRKGDGARVPGGSSRVRELQALFDVLGYPLGREGRSGVFGVRTEGAVRYFQRKRGLPATGVVGSQTLRSLRSEARRLRLVSRGQGTRVGAPVGTGRTVLERGPELLALLVGLALAAVSLWPARRRRAPAPQEPALDATARGALAALALAPASTAVPLGRILLDAGALPFGRLLEALRDQQRWGGRLGEILVARGLVDHQVLRAALAVHTGVPPLAEGEQGEPRLPAMIARAVRAVALKGSDGVAEGTRVAFADPTPRALETVERVLGGPLTPLLAEDAQLDRLLRDAYGDEDVAAAEAVLQEPARRQRRRRLRVVAWGLAAAAACLGGLWLAPVPATLCLVALVGLVQARTAGRNPAAGPTAPAGPTGAAADDGSGEPAPLPPGEPRSRLPRYTLLVPLVDASAATLRRCLAACAVVEYPAHLLEGLLLVPADDLDALVALADADLPPWLGVAPVALSGRPSAAALALVGIRNARGQLTAVLDPELPPHPRDLALAADALTTGQPPALSLNGHAALDQAGPLVGEWLKEPAARGRRARFARGTEHDVPRSQHFVTDALREALGWSSPAVPDPGTGRLLGRSAG